MQTIKIDINKITDSQVELVVDYLRQGAVIAYPTDTIYGLGCDARNALAVEKIKKIKGPAFAPQNGASAGKRDKPLIVLVSDYEMLKQYCVVSEEQEEYLKGVWSEHRVNLTPLTPLWKGGKLRPVTVILESLGNLPVELTGGLKSLAVRLPASDFLVKIISKAGFPIVSTSLNKTGEPPLNGVSELEKHFSELPDLVVDAGPLISAPSRLIDARNVKKVQVIRG